VEKMVSFGGPRGGVDREALQKAVQERMPALRQAWGGLELSAQASGTQGTKVTQGTQAVQGAQGSQGTHGAVSLLPLYQRGLSAMKAEMQATADLSKLPCRSFHDHPNPLTAAKLPIPPKKLSADCSSPLVTCSVNYDKTEHKRSSAL
jgi:hypothetical protein